ncbi:MAG: hypothetical protein WA252_08495 [Candidatus Sulfotelmatobacter sp.]
MLSAKSSSRGFTLVASLLLTLLLSGVAIALLSMVTTEQRSGGTDLSNNYTYRSAEGAMEKMTSDLANSFQSIQSPTAAQICALSNNPPTWDATVTYPTYSVAPSSTTGGSCPPLTSFYGQIAAGPDTGLYAQIMPVTLNVIAQRINGQETVSMTRTAEVALIPVFQFGVFSDSDLFYGQSPNLGFAGRVHTNGDLYLGVANGDYLVFGDKLSAFGNVIREQMDNGMTVGGGLDDGTVLIPTTSGGCNTQLTDLNTGSSISASATCVNIAGTALGATDGSVTGGHGSAQFTPWYNVSLGTPYQGYIIDGNGTPGGTADGTNGTGATDLTLPFVNGTTSAIQIIRRPPVGESTTSLLGASRLANEATIRVLLSDQEADLHLPGWNGDATQDVELASLAPEFTSTAFSANGITVGANTYYFGEAACGVGTVGSACTQGDTNFVLPPWVPGGTTATHYATQAEWPLINGWLLVEVQNSTTGLWVGVTKEWLGLGFARGVQVPTGPGAGPLAQAAQSINELGATGSNYLTDHRNAILYFQMTADRNFDGTVTNVASPTGDQVTFTSVVTHGSVTPVATTYSGTNSQYNWYPINLYDAREGEVYDGAPTSSFPYSAPGNGTVTKNASGTPNGIMNAVELDVGNLNNWLAGVTGSTGTQVAYAAQNGYILYFSDRRGMQYSSASPTALIGEYGFEDTVNFANLANDLKPDGILDPVNYNGVSPEDVNGNGVLDNYGVKTVGDAFGTQTTTDTDSTVPPNPYLHRVTLWNYAHANRVTGARHVLKLVDGSLGNLPVMPAGNATNDCSQSVTNPTGCGGFTVASENPVYIQGNYNSNCPASVSGTPNPCTPGNANYDPTWTSTTANDTLHSAASVIADAVTLLSNNWQDAGCYASPATAACTSTTQLTSGSLLNPINPYRSSGDGQNIPALQPNRLAVTTYYRTAISGGKTIAFNNAAGTPDSYFGSDGGVHNFLRQLEDWLGATAGYNGGAQQALWYKGSLVSLYWNMYATGTWKCCSMVYNPPDRHYVFDPLFSSPANLPPGTPMFRNVDNLSYRQNQTARSN